MELSNRIWITSEYSILPKDGPGRSCCRIGSMDFPLSRPLTSGHCPICRKFIIFGYFVYHDENCQNGCEEDLGIPPRCIMCLECFQYHPRIAFAPSRPLVEYAEESYRFLPLYLYFLYLPRGLNTKGSHNKP